MIKLLRLGMLFFLSIFPLSLLAQDIDVPASPVKYQLIGSFHDGENFNVDMVDNQYTFESIGSVFFKIKDKDNNIYYGAVMSEGAQGSDGKNYTPLAGAYNAASSDNPDGVGSLYFTMNEGFRYTIIIQEPTADSTEENYIISLKVEEIKDGNFDIEACSNSTLTQGMFWPMLISDEGLENATITSISVSSWDYPFVSERFARVFYWSSPEGETYHLSDWDSIIGEGEKIEEDTPGSEGAHNWLIDPTSYADDTYCYQLVVVMNVDGKSKRYVVNSDRFLINSSGDPLVIRAYYLVQRGAGTGEYYTLPTVDNTNVYEVTNLNGSLGNSGNILFSKANVEDETIDFGDENQFRFTDQILIRSNKPYGIDSHMIEKFSLYNVTDPENPVLLIDTESNGNAYNNDEGRFMSIAECQINTQEYKLVLDYRDENGNQQSLEATTSIAVTIPSPKIQESYVEFYKGTDATAGTDNATQKFEYAPLSPLKNPFSLNYARYHNLRQYVKLIKPNTTEVLGQKMLDTGSGSFSYFYECYRDGEVVNTVNLRFQSDNSGDEHSVVWETTGPRVIPEELLMPDQQGNYDSRVLSYSHNFPTAVYDRWGDGTLRQIEITDDPPACDVPASISGSDLHYRPNANNSNLFDLVEDFTMKISLNDNAQSNRIKYNDGMVGELLHKSPNDYYYVVIVDTETEGFDPSGPTKQEYIASTGLQNYPERVYSATELADGVEIPFTHVHARTNKEVWNDDVEYAFNNPYSKRLQLRISYLYPFLTYSGGESASDISENDEAINSKSIYKRVSSSTGFVPSNLRGNVIMSKPLVFDLEPDKVTTGVEKISLDNEVKIASGEGYVTILGGEGAIYSIDGKLLATGNGYIAVPAGIYIVKAGQITKKIVVR